MFCTSSFLQPRRVVSGTCCKVLHNCLSDRVTKNMQIVVESVLWCKRVGGEGTNSVLYIGVCEECEQLRNKSGAGGSYGFGCFSLGLLGM